MTDGEDDFPLARHPQCLASEALHHERVAPQCVDLRRQAVVLRLERLDLSKKLLVLLSCLPEAEDAALAEERVEHRRRDDQEGGESKRLASKGSFDETAALGRGLRTRAIIIGARSHVYQTV